jgi:hypothetical protein
MGKLNHKETEDENGLYTLEDSPNQKETSETETDFKNFLKNLGREFPNFDSFTLRWAEKKAKFLHEKDKSISEITESFAFHNEVWGKYNAMIERVPMQKRGAFLKIFIDILYGEKYGKTHEIKLKKVAALESAINGFDKYKTLARYEIAKTVKIGKIMQSALDILYTDTPKKFESVAKNLGTDFFKQKLETRNLKGLKIGDDPIKFFDRFKTIKDLEKFLTEIKTATTADTKDLLASADFSKQEKSKFLTTLSRLDENNPLAIFKFITDLQEQRDIHNQETKAEAKKEKNKKVEKKDKKEIKNVENDETEVIDLDKKRKEKEAEKAKNKPEIVDESLEKQQRRLELQKLIHHAEKVKEAIGTRPDTFWKDPNQRIPLLENSGELEEYKKLNSDDPNIPSTSKKIDGEKLTPRWVNYKRNFDMQGSIATCSHLDTLEDSGYKLAGMMGFFSIDWKNDNSRLYTPDEFMSLMKFKLANLDRSSELKNKEKLKKAA